ncbi:MAG: radical SAM protein [archaeon]
MNDINVALLFLPTQTNEASAEAPAVDSQGGVFPPLQLAYLGAVLEKAGHAAKIIDVNALNLGMGDAVQQLKKFNPRIIGISSSVVMWRETIKWARVIKRHLKADIVVGGTIMSHYPHEVLSFREIDYGVVGHDQQTLLGLIGAIISDGSLDRIEGLAFRSGSRVTVNPFSERRKFSTKDLNKLPLPARHLLPNDRYFEFYTKKRNFTIMLASTGCRYNCKFCASRLDPLVYRPVEDVVNEMRVCYAQHGVREIDFKDNTFTMDRKRTQRLCAHMAKKGLNRLIRWSCMTRADLVNEPLLKQMKQAGCVHIKYGIESGSQEILDRLGKGVTLDKIRESVYFTKKLGMEAYGFFMIGVPGETRETAQETIRFAHSLGLGRRSLVCRGRHDAYPPEVSGYYPELKHELGYDMWRRYILDENYKLPRRNLHTELSEDEVNMLTLKAYRSFYFRPGHVLSSLIRHRDASIIRKGAVAALSMLTNGRSLTLTNSLRKKRKFI